MNINPRLGLYFFDIYFLSALDNTAAHYMSCTEKVAKQWVFSFEEFEEIKPMPKLSYCFYTTIQLLHIG